MYWKLSLSPLSLSFSFPLSLSLSLSLPPPLSLSLSLSLSAGEIRGIRQDIKKYRLLYYSGYIYYDIRMFIR